MINSFQVVLFYLPWMLVLCEPFRKAIGERSLMPYNNINSLKDKSKEKYKFSLHNFDALAVKAKIILF